ncbi:MAG: DEAD/DEAH box helicase family protein [Kiritimatiellae bacterium]|nr:DEAD/DEAH box helicase family protein [Kiritimatiellia bacterium]
MAFFVSEKYATTRDLAAFSYEANAVMQRKYTAKGEYLDRLIIPDKKSVSIDLATGTGKSWVIFGVAQILLAEGFVDKVLVLCPSLTIEEELKAKFERFCGDDTLTKILEELGARYPSPGIKSANVPILDGDICVENIHAAYERTGSSIEDSFKGKGSRTLVISDEAHHIYSGADASTKKWFDFLVNPDYGFQYLLGLSGTPYIEDDYFHDVIFRYGLQQAMEDGVVKKINYKVEESKTAKGWFETYANHAGLKEKYDGVLKPISIVITDKIVTCVQVWNELIGFLMETEKISRQEAERKVIWVASGVPSNPKEKAEVLRLVPSAEKVRKANLLALKTVDEFESDVEWIVSVSMLTEGWDVKNVFQIVPHEQRAFCSKLLISQVLGRGLRIPAGLEHPVYVTINNHERWTDEIRDLYRGVLETESRISWGYDPARAKYAFPLYNLTYSSQQDTVETKEKKADAPQKVVLQPQDESREETSEYSETGTFRFRIEMRDRVSLQQAAREMKLFLKDHDDALATKWPVSRIKKWIQVSLKACGYADEWVSRENLGRLKQSFGPVFRETGKSVPRMKLQADGFVKIETASMHRQSFCESQLRNQKGYMLFDANSGDALQPDEKELFNGFVGDRGHYDRVKEACVRYGGRGEDVTFLKENLIDVPELTGPQNLLFLSSKPELGFVKTAVDGFQELFDSILKSPDRGFYEIPYSYKPTEKGGSHVRRENFNPDFLMKVKDQNRLLVVEIKGDHDDTKKNRAKQRDAREHCDQLNQMLESNGIDWTYHFYFLSPEDYGSFFKAVADKNWYWQSQLMQELGKTI